MPQLFLSTYQGRVVTLQFSPQVSPKYALTEVASTDAVGPKPTWITLDTKRRILYCTEGGSSGQGFLKSFTIQADGSLKELGSVHVPVGACSQILYRGASTVTIPYYASGLVGTYNLKDPAKLQVLQETSFPFFEPGPGRKQDQRRPHHAMIDPAGRYMIVPDVGADIVRVFRISDDDESPEQLTELDGIHLPKPTFPRQAAFSTLRNGTQMYILTEDSNRLLSFQVQYVPAGGLHFIKEQDINVLERLDGSVIPYWKDYLGSTHGYYPKACHIIVSPDNRFVIISIRGDKSHLIPAPFGPIASIEADSLVSYAIDQETGALTLVDSASAGGSVPRGFALNQTGDLVAVAAQRNGWVSIFDRDPASGKIGNLRAVKNGYGDPSERYGGDVAGPVSLVWDCQTG